MGWDRVRDLSAVIDGMLSDPTFMPRIDRQRIGAAGFSLGGYTMIAIARGITSLAHYQEFCALGAGRHFMPGAARVWRSVRQGQGPG